MMLHPLFQWQKLLEEMSIRVHTWDDRGKSVLGTLTSLLPLRTKTVGDWPVVSTPGNSSTRSPHMTKSAAA